MQLKYSILLCAALLASCSGTENKSGLTFDINSMEIRNLSLKDAKVCANDEMFPGFPGVIRYHPDSLILVKESKSERSLNVIDLKNGSATQYISRGRGPNELIDPWDITIDDGSVWVSSPSDGRIIGLSFDSTERAFRFDKAFDLLKANFKRALPFGNGSFLIQPPSRSTRRLEIIDDSCNVLNYSEYFPEVTDGNSVQQANNAFHQSVIAISPDGKQFVTATLSFNELNIYDDSLQVTKTIKGPIEVKCKLITEETPMGQRFKRDPPYFMYQSISANNQGFFVSYTGCKVTEEKDYDNYPKNIFSFDWNGKPLVNYCCDFEVMSFDVDPSGHKLYCLIHEPEMQIIVFDI